MEERESPIQKLASEVANPSSFGPTLIMVRALTLGQVHVYDWLS